ncbi:MAG TPA: hypothetical protein VN661_03235 [Candidatus Acidoferrales bacterium]|nr:hypothetical protein [Candidatus Acidoferrales bacterium]
MANQGRSGRLTLARNPSTFDGVPARKVQVGQVWKKDGSSDSFLVTKVYSEALATYAVLRKAGAETEPPMRVKVIHNGASQNLPGFAFAQESDEF